MSWAFWSDPLWSAYCEAYDFTGKRRPDDGAAHMILPLGGADYMLARMTRGHRGDLKYASTVYTEDWGAFDAYERLHQSAFPDARGQSTYDIQRRMCVAGVAFAVCARTDHPVAAALFFVKDEGAYYASAARCEHVHRGAAAFVVWRAMLYLSGRGVKWLDMGPAPDERASDKERLVAAFKHHLGAEYPPEVEGGLDQFWVWR